MHEDFDAEIRLLLQEGLLRPEDAEEVRAKARAAGSSPIGWMVPEGRISAADAARLRLSTPTLAPPPEAEASQPEPPPRPAGAPETNAAREEAPPPPPPSSSGAQDWPLPGWERFTPIQFLGQGGMGSVWLVVKADLGNEVALKLVRADGTAQVQQLVEEGHALAKVKHDRVCKVHEVGVERGYAYIAMQYVDGETLGAEGLALTVKQRAQLLRDVALGVQAVHDVGVIHRDIKPSNILVERSSEGLKPYLVDFGVARSWNVGATSARSVVGTPHYMSPEQANGEVATLDRRADVYGLGATLYHLLTGRPPFTGGGVEELLERVRADPPAPPRQLEPSVPEDLSAIALRCLQKDRTKRYDSARELADDLGRYLSGDPVRARSGALYWLGRRLTRYWVPASLGAVVALVLGGARYDAVQRERLARDITERVGEIEALERFSALAPRHDLQQDRADLRRHMADVEKMIEENGERAEGPGRYALGKGYLALGAYAPARDALRSAWSHGYRDPKVAYALAIALGHEYQEKLTAAQRESTPLMREEAVAAVQRRYRPEVLEYLRSSEGVKEASPHYLAALIAFYEQDYDGALDKLNAAGETRAWWYEIARLQGDILKARAFKRWEENRREAGEDDYNAARKAYQRATATAPSLPDLYAAQARLELLEVAVQLYGEGDVQGAYDCGMDALRPMAELVPDDPERLVLEAQLNRHLADYRATRGGNTEGPLGEALGAAEQAASAPLATTAASVELAQVHWQRALSQIKQSRDPSDELRQAADLLERVGTADQDADFFLILGRVYSLWATWDTMRDPGSSGHLERTIQAFTSATMQDPRHPRAWSNLAYAYYTRATLTGAKDPDGDLALAKRDEEKALELNSRFIPAYYDLGVYIGRTIARRDRTLGKDPRPALAEALGQLEKGREVDPRYVPMLNALGELRLDLSEADWDWGRDPFAELAKADEAFQQAHAVSPDENSVAANLGETTARQARYRADRGEDPTALAEKALERFADAAKLAPDSPAPLTGQGILHLTLARFELDRRRDPGGHLENAIAFSDEVEKTKQNIVDKWWLRGSAQWLEARRSGRGPEGYERAAATYRKGLESFPGDWELLREYALVCLDRADPAVRSGKDPGEWLRRADALTAQMEKIRPNLPEAVAFRAWARALEGERAALADLDEALRKNPNLEFEWRPRRNDLAKHLSSKDLPR